MNRHLSDVSEPLPVVSIIIPVYRAIQFLPRCIDSLLWQSCQSFEIILVDDGSDDNSPALCDRYAEEHPQVIAIHQQHLGPAAARNAGLEAAKGQYIAFVDADDWVHADYLKSLLQHIGDADMCCCGHEIVSDEVQPVPPVQSEASVCTGAQALTRDDCRIYIWGRLYRRASIADIRFDASLKNTEDRLFNAAFFVNHSDSRCVILPTKLYYYYQHEDETTKNPAFSDLPAIGKMIELAGQTRNEWLLKYMIEWLYTKRRSGFHIGNPPDYAAVEACMLQCAGLADKIMPGAANRMKYKMMMNHPVTYKGLCKIRRIVSRVIMRFAG